MSHGPQHFESNNWQGKGCLSVCRITQRRNSNATQRNGRSGCSACDVETFLEGVTDKSTGLPIFKELVWFAYKVSGVMCSVSACEHRWSIEEWIHSKRRNKLHQTLVEKLVRAHTNLVLRESLDDTLHHLLPWDLELIIDDPVDEPEEEPEV